MEQHTTSTLIPLSNYHSHCTFCDGRSAPDDFVRFALSNGFRAYGFSSHSPLPFETFWNMSANDMPEYLAEIERIKRKYSDRIAIYVGLEIDYLDESYNPSIPYFQSLPLDYRIGSVHFLPIAQPLTEANMMCIDGSFKEFALSVEKYFENDIRLLVKRYFHSIQAMVEAGGFDIVGHLDKIYMNGQMCAGFSTTEAWYKNPLLTSLDLIAEQGLMVEINTKNLLSKGNLYPHRDYLHALRERGIPVMVNSDCHYPQLVNDGREEAFQLLRTAGFRTTRELVDGHWQEVAIDGKG